MKSLVIAALRTHAPFDEMDAASLRFLASRLQLAYYPARRASIGPDSGVGRPAVHHQAGQRARRGAAADVVLGAGECFPIGALIGAAPPPTLYRAAEDCFCWELPAADFHPLLERSRQFHAFCTRYLARLVERSQRAQRAAAAQALLDGSGMLAPLSSRCGASRWPARRRRRWARCCARCTRRAHRLDGGGRRRRVPLGMFTLPDVLERVAAAGAAMDTPIERVMTPRPVTLEEEATARRRGAGDGAPRHPPHRGDARRQLAGVVSERDLFAL